MVTAVVIPILIIYFYWITRKEAAKQKDRWENLNEFPLESRVEGKVIQLHTEKKRFYHQLYTLNTTIQLKLGEKTTTIVYKQPFKDTTFPPPIAPEDEIMVNGKWEGDRFLAGEITLTNTKRQP